MPLLCTDKVEAAVGTNVGATGGSIPKQIADDAVGAAVLFPGALEWGKRRQYQGRLEFHNVYK